MRGAALAIMALAVSLSAMPSNAADTTGYFGVRIGTTEKGGAVVHEVVRGSPAEQLGMRPSYIILGVGTQPVKDADDAANLLGQSTPGRWDSIYYAVEGQVFSGLYVVAHPTLFELFKLSLLPDRGRIGAEVVTDTSGRGAKIVTVFSNEPAEVAGLRGGDVIVELDGRQMQSSEEVVVTTANAVGRILKVKFVRNDRVLFTEARVAKSHEKVSLEITPERLAASRAASGNATDEKAWCDRSGFHTAVCIGAGIVVLGVAAAILGGGKGRSTDRDRGGDTPTAMQPEEPRVLRVPDPPPSRDETSRGPSAPPISPFYGECHGRAIGLC